MMATQTISQKFNTLRASRPGEYDSGILIETLGYWNRDTPSWGVPAWEERGLPDLCGPFRSLHEANCVLRESAGYLEDCGYSIEA